MPYENRFRLFRRSNGIFFVQDNVISKQESLRTRDRKTARRLLGARNEAHEQPAIRSHLINIILVLLAVTYNVGGWI